LTADRPARPEPGTIASVLHNVRRAPHRVRRQSREFVETAVTQLFDAAVRHPHGAAASGEYRIEELARLAGTTTRNIRVYRDRDLLPPPLRVGRIALFNDTHLTRLRLITSMLDRGYTIAHVREMLSAWATSWGWKRPLWAPGPRRNRRPCRWPKPVNSSATQTLSIDWSSYT
jgi:hypothetical protein